MKFLKNKLKYGVVAAIVAATILYTTKQFILKPQNQIRQSAQEIPAKEYFGKQLEQELSEVWQSFNKIGLNQQRYEQAKQEKRENYLRSDFPGGPRNISAPTVKLVHGIMKEFGIDPETIIIVSYKDISPAAATERVLYINEAEFNNYSDAAQRFVIGHELQHILNKDNHSRYTLQLILHNTADTKEHPVCQYNRFKEKRADVSTATLSLDWAQGYLAFAKEWHKRAGDNPGITHPLNKDRVALAEQIVDYMRQQNIA